DQLRDVQAVHDRLVLAEGAMQRCDWAIDRWLEPVVADVESISAAARLLRSIQRNWMPCGDALHRRSELLREQLPFVSAKPLRFPEAPKAAPLASYLFIDPHHLLYSAKRSSPFPNGEANFVEYDEVQGPPSRAYLKLFEALSLLGQRP